MFHLDQVWIDLIIGVGSALIGWFAKHFVDKNK